MHVAKETPRVHYTRRHCAHTPACDETTSGTNKEVRGEVRGADPTTILCVDPRRTIPPPHLTLHLFVHLFVVP